MSVSVPIAVPQFVGRAQIDRENPGDSWDADDGGEERVKGQVWRQIGDFEDVGMIGFELINKRPIDQS